MTPWLPCVHCAVCVNQTNSVRGFEHTVLTIFRIPSASTTPHTTWVVLAAILNMVSRTSREGRSHSMCKASVYGMILSDGIKVDFRTGKSFGQSRLRPRLNEEM